MITIQELLASRGLTADSEAKLVRHKDVNLDLYGLYCQDKQKFLEYQSQQSQDVFGNVRFVVSFIGEDGTRARFIGVFEVKHRHMHSSKQAALFDGYYQFSYVLEEVQGFEDLRDRVIIDWGKSTIQWCQWLSNIKPVVEIQAGLHYVQFTDYFDFILNFRQLRDIISNEYRDWKRMLSATKGVYLISDTKTGKLYVGSAYGEGGIWSRWQVYVRTNGHGNNVRLKELVQANPAHADAFNFSILMLLPSTVTADEAIRKERLYKLKLGTNSFGLNSN